jgi:hypothetical protein
MRMLLRAVVLLIVVMSAISAIRGLLHMLQAAKREGGRPTGTGRLVKDPVCGTYVAQQTALSARNEFYCSEECHKIPDGHALKPVTTYLVQRIRPID